MLDIKALAANIAALSQSASTLSEAERKQRAENLIEEIKSAVAKGANLNQAYAYAQELTPYIEPQPKPLEALNYQLWMALKDSHTPPPAPTPVQREQIGLYAKASEQVIDEVLASVVGEEQQYNLIEEKLSALRKQIFGMEEPQFLLQ
ncbi:phospholipase C accessory protein PlcR [Pseudomonas sp. MSSRFD41]|uniref:phospholipase C accessory protein PlcR n=1 Tax=Pseudomonas sp. MSSRFD41 TaxID=1310370 RepID=UPI00163A4DC3|nr:phospholipase C accessory protein PlcR [Pseudomonas sp. MSSRFD41]MBC2657475.1 phospholipase C accessory protein PlcR [Pseudomonas sp. MSSRFD41]